MSGWVLLIIGLASLALVLAMLVWLALRGWRLTRHGIAVARSTGAVAGEVAGRAGGLEVSLSRLQTNADQLRANLVRLQATAERFRVLADALGDALAPYRSVRSFFGKW